MMRAQRYIRSMMENVAEGQIGSDEHRVTFARIRSKLSGAEDFESELRQLYKVAGFGQFALGLMWIAERVERDTSKEEYTPEEQSFIVSQFRFAVGDFEEPPLAATIAPASTEGGGTAEAEGQTEQPTEETPEMPAHLEMETHEGVGEPEPAGFTPPPVAGPGGETEFSSLMEKFVEAMQSGSEERENLTQSVLAQSTAIAGGASGAPDDLKEFCQYLVEFLQYIMENGFMDDVRVMNILSNVSGPVSSWAQTAPDAREGILSEGTEILRTFKSLFE